MRRHTPTKVDTNRELQHLALKLKTLRDERGWSQTRLAAEAGIDRTIIVRIEQAERPPRFHQLIALHKALGVPRGSLLAA